MPFLGDASSFTSSSVATLLALKSKLITNTTKLHSPVSTKTFFIMSDNNSYEYDNDADEDMEDNIEYTDEEEVTEEADDAEVALENAYYNAKGLHADSIEDAVQAFEEVITSEKRENDNKYGPWSFTSMKQLVKLYLKLNNATYQSNASLSMNAGMCRRQCQS
jgi:hypothetical protein